jgi:ABC-type transporter Mla subunit MlaD
MAGTAFGFGLPITSAITPSTPLGLSMLPLQQVHQLLQSVPQQLQALQQLEYIQQQQLQQLLQIVPAQLAQLQQLIQAALAQLQQSGQPLGQMAGAGFAVSPWGITPQFYGAQPGQVM